MAQQKPATQMVEPPTTPDQKPPSVEDATRDLVAALRHIGPARLTHAYGCPAEHAGPCTCGTAELIAAAQKLETALQAPAAPSTT